MEFLLVPLILGVWLVAFFGTVLFLRRHPIRRR